MLSFSVPVSYSERNKIQEWDKSGNPPGNGCPDIRHIGGGILLYAVRRRHCFYRRKRIWGPERAGKVAGEAGVCRIKDQLNENRAFVLWLWWSIQWVPLLRISTRYQSWPPGRKNLLTFYNSDLIICLPDNYMALRTGRNITKYYCPVWGILQFATMLSSTI